jgi:hypothetical protein
MKNQLPIMADDEHRVLKFRPRTTSRPPLQRTRSTAEPSPRDAPEPNDLSRYENTAAFAFTVALTAIGIWLAMSIADLRKTQDCVLMGRRDCAQISSPHS